MCFPSSSRIEHVFNQNPNMEPVRYRPAVSNFAKDTKVRLEQAYFQVRSFGRFRLQKPADYRLWIQMRQQLRELVGSVNGGTMKGT